MSWTNCPNCGRPYIGHGTVCAPQSSAPEIGREFETYSKFFAKHALGPKSAPSCLVCGHVITSLTPAIQHLELPGIVVCHSCRDAKHDLAKRDERITALEKALREAPCRCSEYDVSSGFAVKRPSKLICTRCAALSGERDDRAAD